VTVPIACWCGCDKLEDYSIDYRRCQRCGTLVSALVPTGDLTKVLDEDGDLYGREYWLSHQEKDLGQPNIGVRARTDLPERCLRWLRTLLKYKLPPADVIEVGSGHGGFVALLRWAGFEAVGSELSPWVVQFSSRIFQVPIVNAPIEELALPARSQEVVVLIDVLEHLRDPRLGIARCAELLRDGGVALIQTPVVPEQRSYEDLQRSGDRFLEMLLPEEHLYLFSRPGLAQLLAEFGLVHTAFEPALFPYDMLVLASQQPLPTHNSSAAARALQARPSGRLVQALLDLDDTLQESERLKCESEADRSARLTVIEAQGSEVGELQAERNNLAAQLTALQGSFQTVEVDRADRLELIQNLGNQVGELQAERNNLDSQLASLQMHFDVSEKDRADRLVLIEDLGKQVGELQADRSSLEAQLADLKGRFNAVEEDRAARLAIIERLTNDVQRLLVEREQLEQRMGSRR
jgi:SAM-dependent methyltransferase